MRRKFIYIFIYARVFFITARAYITIKIMINRRICYENYLRNYNILLRHFCITIYSHVYDFSMREICRFYDRYSED